jgi:protein-disulfide isomerase
MSRTLGHSARGAGRSDEDSANSQQEKAVFHPMTSTQRPTSQPITRRERRRIEREERATKRPTRKRVTRKPAWQSPMFLITATALVIGAAVIGFAILQRPADALPTDELVSPDNPITAEVAALADGRTLGSANAPVTVEIWSDFQCPACRVFAEETEPGIIDDFVVPGTAKLVYRDAAFQGQRGDPAYDESVEAAAAARSAAEQGKFWQMHNWIFANWSGENEGAFRAQRLREIAGAAGLDLAQYDSSMASGEHQAAVRAETNDGVAAGVNSTPTIVVNGAPFSGALSYDQLAQLIMQAAE